MFHHEQTTQVLLRTFLAGAKSRGHCIAGGSQGPECGVSSSVPLAALRMAQQQVGLGVCSQPWRHVCSCFPGALENCSLALGRGAQCLGMSCKRSFTFPYLFNRAAEAFVSRRGQGGLKGLSL